MEVDPELVVPDPAATLGEGVIQPWSGAHVADYFSRLLEALGDELGFDLDTPWEDLPAKAADGDPATATRPRSTCGTATATAASAPTTPTSRASSPTSSAVTARPSPTPAGSGSRASCARSRARRARAAGSSRSRWRSPSAARASPRSARCRSTRPPTSCATSSCPRGRSRSPSGCSRRSRSGSGSCSTSASTTSPSTGRRARCRAARRSGSGWPPRSAPAWSACSTSSTSRRIGLHQRDNQRLIETLVRLKDLGNTLIVVEHDEDTIRTADWVVDIGPGAGEHGGQVVALRAPSQGLLEHPDSTDRPLPVRSQGDPGPRRTPSAHQGPRAGGPRCSRAQPPGHRRRVPARAVRGGHRGVRLGQVDAGQRHPLHVAGQADLQRPHGARPAHARSPAWSTSTR